MAILLYAYQKVKSKVSGLKQSNLDSTGQIMLELFFLFVVAALLDGCIGQS